MKTIDLELLKSMPLPEWDEEATKKTRGKLLLVGGSKRIPGAVILAARAALRAGCGSVRVAAPESIALAVGIALPELMVVPLPETSAGTIAESAKALIAEQCKVCNAVAIGPGLDENEETDALVREVVAQAPLPLLVDAQAISALGTNFSFKKTPRILTPHEAEFEALYGKKVTDREKVTTEWAKSHGVYLSLKGKSTLIGTPEGETYGHENPLRALGTAGSGDVLAGIIGSLLAQGLEPLQATIWGVYFHNEAGQSLSKDGGEDGILAGDLINQLPYVQKYLRRQTEEKKVGGFGLRR